MTRDASATLADYIAAFRRRFRRMATVAFSVLFVALLFAYGVPPTYTATATILFESPDVPADIVRSTITAQRDEYISNITKRALRGRNLLPLVEKYHLFDSPDFSKDDRVGRLAGAVQVNPVLEESVAKRRASVSDLTIGFTLAFSYTDPVITKNVTQELAQIFLEENVASRTEAARGAAGFLTKDTDRLREEIATTEKAVTDFKAANAQYLPDFKTVMQAQVERSESQVLQLQQSLQASTEREIFLRAQLAQVSPRVVNAAAGQDVDPRSRLEDLTAEYVRLSAIYTPEHPDIVRLKRAIQQARTQAGVSTSVIDIADALAAKEAELRTAQQTYAPDHPDVVRLNRAVADLRAQLQQVSQQEASQTRPNNPAYIQLQAQLDAQAAEKRSIQAQIADMRARADEARNRLLRMPEVERQLLALTRDYDFAVGKFKDASARQGKAELAESLETESKGERLAIRQGPSVPRSPSYPNRLLVIFFGVAAGLALAGGSGILAEAMDRTVRGSLDLVGALEMPPVATIPYIETHADVARRRRRFVLSAGACTACIAVIVLLAIWNG